MRFYDCRGFPNPDRVRIALGEKGLLDTIEVIQIDVAGSEHRGEAYLAKNPAGFVPALELDDGTILSECTAITEYLDTQFTPVRLTGGTPRMRGLIHMFQRQFERGLLDAVAAYFHHATPGLGPDIEQYQNADWGRHNLQTAFTTARAMDAMLENQPYIAGPEFSMVDITAFAGFAFARIAGVELEDGLANVARWRAAVTSRPSFQTV